LLVLAPAFGWGYFFRKEVKNTKMILKLILIILTSLLGYFLGDKFFITRIASLIGLGCGAVWACNHNTRAENQKMTTWVILGLFGLVVGLFMQTSSPLSF
jgi:hypothetical protein